MDDSEKCFRKILWKGIRVYNVCLYLFDFEKYYTRLSKNFSLHIFVFDAETFSKHFILEYRNFKFDVLLSYITERCLIGFSTL